MVSEVTVLRFSCFEQLREKTKPVHFILEAKKMVYTSGETYTHEYSLPQQDTPDPLRTRATLGTRELCRVVAKAK
jgi:hypothetical protein